LTHFRLAPTWQVLIPCLVLLSLSNSEARGAETKPAPIERQELDFTPLELIPVQSDARTKPLRVYAAEVLEEVTGRPLFGFEPSYRPKDGAPKLKGLDLYFSMLFHTREWEKEAVILIPSATARQELGLPSDKKRVSLKKLSEADVLWKAWHKRDQNKKLTPTEKQMMDVASRFAIAKGILEGDGWLVLPHPSRKGGAWLTPALLFLATEDRNSAVMHLAQDRYRGKPKQAAALIDEYLQAYGPETVRDLQIKLKALRDAYVKRDPVAFNTAAVAWRDALAALAPSTYPPQETLTRELHYHALRPFRWAWLFYLFAGLLGLLFLRSKSTSTTVTVWTFFIIGLAFHTYGFALRALIAGRSPVSNMYESVVYAALGCSMLGLFFEWRNRKKYFLLSSALASFVLLLLMDVLPIVTGDPANSGFNSQITSFDGLLPVLKDHFWLAIHVLTITLSYGAFALAWILAHITLTRVLLNPMQQADHRELLLSVYDVLKAGVFLLAVGTILGAFWGHYAWGRFWGWDAKEVWSLIALLAYIFVLHMRFTGYWNDITFAVGAVVCFLSIVMAWYGVNFILGSGLHSYGAGTGGGWYVLVLVLIDLFFVSICLVRYLPHRKTATAPAGGADEDTEE